MRDGEDQSGLAFTVDTVMGSLIFKAVKPAAADRTDLREDEFDLGTVSFFLDRTDNFRNDITGFADDDCIADADVLIGDVVFIVKRRKRNRRSCDLDRCQFGIWRTLACTSHRDKDVFHLGSDFLCRELIGDGPFRNTGCKAKLSLQLIGIDLDDHAVDLIRKIMADLLRIIDEPDDIFDIVEKACRLIDDETQFSGIFQRTVMRIGIDIIRYMIPEAIQTAGCADP